MKFKKGDEVRWDGQLTTLDGNQKTKPSIGIIKAVDSGRQLYGILIPGVTAPAWVQEESLTALKGEKKDAD